MRASAGTSNWKSSSCFFWSSVPALSKPVLDGEAIEIFQVCPTPKTINPGFVIILLNPRVGFALMLRVNTFLIFLKYHAYKL
jgi:hypothetical protein